MLRFKRGAIIFDTGVRRDTKPRQNDIFINFRSSKDGYEGPLSYDRLGVQMGGLKEHHFYKFVRLHV